MSDISKGMDTLGIDIGSVAICLAQIAEDKTIKKTAYIQHHGDIAKKLLSALNEFDLGDISHLAATASTPSDIQADRVYDDQIAVIKAVRHFHKNAGSLLQVGGEKFSIVFFDENGNYRKSRRNTACAAGTGSFLDQQAGRLKLENAENLCRIACANRGEIPKIASRCAVFAKTDLIHAQQEGYTLDEISDGLCFGLAKNITDTLFGGETIAEPVIFCGGVSKNQAVINHMNGLLGTELVTDENSHLYGAIGAGLALVDDIRDSVHKTHGCRVLSADRILKKESSEKSMTYPPLELKLSSYPDFASLEKYECHGDGEDGTSPNPVEVDIYEDMNGRSRVSAFIGIDIGSTSTKAVLVDPEKKVLAGFYTRTAGAPLKALQAIYRSIDKWFSKKGIEIEIEGCSSTGSGRKFIGKITGADLILDEITAHARAATELDGEVDTIIEIGGQDSKFTTLQDGVVTSSTMNNVCAAGTGSFIEEQAQKLGCPVSEYSDRCENVAAPMASDRCTVFMERDINHYLIEGYTVNEVLASALHSVRENYLLKVASEASIGDRIFFQGATAKNKALVAAFEQKLKRPIIVSRYCHLTGALGAALCLIDEKNLSESNRKNSFRGLEIYRQKIPVRSETCTLCTNHCKITTACVDGVNVAYGFLCGRDYDTKKYVSQDKGSVDLVKRRKNIFSFKEKTGFKEDFSIGIPAALYLLEDVPMWKKFFNLLSIRTITSEGFLDGVKTGKNISGAEFCAPVSEMHGHVTHLMDRADYIFIPFYLEKKNRDKEKRRQYCYYSQFIPALVSSVGNYRKDIFLTPVIKYLHTEFYTKMQLYRMLKGIVKKPISFFEVSNAYDRAMAFKEDCREKLKKMYSETSDKNEDVRVVFLGRPYTVLSPALNNKIPEIFASLGIGTFFQDMLSISSRDTEPIEPLLNEIHWNYASVIMKAAEKAAVTEGLYPVFITSFKCSPDSFATDYFKKIMAAHNKPYLILELDEHDSSIGYETRIEAAVRAFRNHLGRKENKPGKALPLLDSVNPRMEKSIEGKTVIIPNWDSITCRFLTAVLQGEGYDAILMEETEETIQRSLKHNTGQCIPLNAIAEGYMECIKRNRLDPANTVLWMSNSELACNIKLYPHHIKTILRDHSEYMGKASVYKGEITFIDISINAAINAYFAYMFGGLLRKIGCRIRPYEVERGETDKVMRKSIEILSEAFRGKISRKEALSDVISRFQWIETRRQKRSKVAIFGDMYVRDNSIMNQDLIHFIEENGGEVITTPYSEYAKMIAGTYFKKWFDEGKYLHLLSSKTIMATLGKLEKIYYRYFSRLLDDLELDYSEPTESILAQYGIAPQNTGESMDNILKIFHIKNHYPDVDLFVQTCPGLCCASLITEAMIKRIEEKTGVPVVNVTYDGTCGNKNRSIIPYLAFPRNKPEIKDPFPRQRLA